MKLDVAQIKDCTFGLLISSKGVTVTIGWIILIFWWNTKTRILPGLKPE